jgi:hypothetical protein
MTTKSAFINPERLCYAVNPSGRPCRGIAVRGQLQCFAHGPRGRRIRLQAIEREERRLVRRPNLTVPELAALATRLGVAHYFPALMVANRANAKE